MLHQHGHCVRGVPLMVEQVECGRLCNPQLVKKATRNTANLRIARCADLNHELRQSAILRKHQLGDAFARRRSFFVMLQRGIELLARSRGKPVQDFQQSTIQRRTRSRSKMGRK